jgi:hypothetical protein
MRTTNQRPECGRRGIDLVIMGTVEKGVQFFNEGFVPGAVHQRHETLFALCGERVGAIQLAAFLTRSALPARSQLCPRARGQRG